MSATNLVNRWIYSPSPAKFPILHYWSSLKLNERSTNTTHNLSFSLLFSFRKRPHLFASFSSSFWFCASLTYDWRTACTDWSEHAHMASSLRMEQMYCLPTQPASYIKLIEGEPQSHKALLNQSLLLAIARRGSHGRASPAAEGLVHYPCPKSHILHACSLHSERHGLYPSIYLRKYFEF